MALFCRNYNALATGTGYELAHACIWRQWLGTGTGGIGYGDGDDGTTLDVSGYPGDVGFSEKEIHGRE